MEQKYSTTAIIPHIDMSIKDLISIFYEKPFKSIYEADIQSLLYNIICKNINNAFNNITPKVTLYHYKKGDQQPLKNITSYIHCQTAIPSINSTKRNAKQHLDIGFWCENNIEKEVNYTDKIVSVGIEIKYSFEKGRKIDIQKDPEQQSGILYNYWLDIKKLMAPKKYIVDDKNNTITQSLAYGYSLWFLPCFTAEKIEEIKKYLDSYLQKTYKNNSNYNTILTLYIISNALKTWIYKNYKWSPIEG